MRYIAVVLLLTCVAVPSLAVADEWTGTPEQKTWGLMTVWAEVKYTFPHFDNRPDLDWDATVQKYLPRVLATEDMESYYAVLQELVALLKDGHTRILPPWGHFKPGYDLAPVEVRILDGRFWVDRVGNDPELTAQGIRPGVEILEIDGLPAERHFAENVLRYNADNTVHGTRSFYVVYLLYGPGGDRAVLKIRASDGALRQASVAYDALGGEHPFMARLVHNALVAETIETRELPGGIVYANIPTFQHARAADDFAALIEGLGDDVKGMIIDVRHNTGGSSRVTRPMTARLIDEAVTSPIMKFRHFVGADVAWGNPPEWETTSNRIEPHDGKRYLGPLVVLTSGLTASSSEDFAIELRAAGRATLVGQTTGGSAGNGLMSDLPGGGTLRVATFTALLPGSEEEFIGVGVAPDVEVWPTPDDLATGRDPVLARALGLLAD